MSISAARVKGSKPSPVLLCREMSAEKASQRFEPAVSNEGHVMDIPGESLLLCTVMFKHLVSIDFL